MRGVAARYPAIEASSGRPVTLAQRISTCRADRQRGVAYALESEPLVSLEAYIAMQSRGLPLAPPADARLAEARRRGGALFRQRVGALDLACTQCHDELAGRRLGGSPIPQAHPTGYPIYRLEWQGVGSLQRRLRNCLSGVRAEPYAYGAPELIDLELYLMQRAAGMALETPAIRP